MKTFICPKEHEDQARKFVESCTTFLLIGFSAHDEDVLDLLRGMPASSRVIIVSNGDATEVRERILARTGSVGPQRVAFELRDEGFSDFIDSVEFSQLVSPEKDQGS